MTDTATLASKLKAIDVRRAELEQLLQREKPGSYRHQELQSEAAELFALRRAITYKIAEADAPGPPRAERLARERRIEAEVSQRRAGLLEWVEVLERQGDYRQARIWRREMLNLREQVEREFGA